MVWPVYGWSYINGLLINTTNELLILIILLAYTCSKSEYMPRKMLQSGKKVSDPDPMEKSDLDQVWTPEFWIYLPLHSRIRVGSEFFSTAGSDPDPASIGLDPETLRGIYGENFLISGWSPILIFNPISLTIENTAVRLNIILQNCTRNL